MLPDLAGDDFRSVAFAAAVLRLVLAGRQPSFDVDLAAFADDEEALGGAQEEGEIACGFQQFRKLRTV